MSVSKRKQYPSSNTASTPKQIKIEKNSIANTSIETITYSPSKLKYEISFNDDDTDSDDSGPLYVDKKYMLGTLDDSFKEPCFSSSNDNDNIDSSAKVEYFPFRDMLIMIIPENSTVYFEGLMSIRVLQGEVEVLGYSINKLSGEKELFSPRGCSRLYIKNKGIELRKSTESIFSNVMTSENRANLEKIVKRIKLRDSVLVCYNINKFQVDFLVNHISQQIYPISESKNSGPLRCTFDQDCENSVKVNPKWSEIIDSVGKYSRILLAGGKSVGKSTMLRYMVNKLLVNYRQVLVIDLDPGQPEFTVPGCISASVVTEPLLGPNFTHLKKPERCIFVPEIDLSEDSDEYIGFVEFLMEQCDNLPTMPTLINHMGFTIGLGFYILSSVVVCARPTTIIDIRSNKNSRNYSEKLSAISVCENSSFLNKKIINNFKQPKIITVDSMSDNISKWQLEPRLIREMCILSYFGKMVTRNGMAITEIETGVYIVDTTNINVIDREGPISFSAINANLVALCSTIRPTKCYNCFGWGIVKGINLDNQDICILTPVAPNVLQNVDTLILGSIHLPPSLLMNSGKVSGLIPYVADGILNKLGELTKRSYIPRALKRVSVNH
ncbi:hypothetical protein FQR65_LT09744 [Abscondita terminalis]|nr:hypothetical protein FQR65_LT09744 [Abscondita terminalis]